MKDIGTVLSHKNDPVASVVFSTELLQNITPRNRVSLNYLFLKPLTGFAMAFFRLPYLFQRNSSHYIDNCIPVFIVRKYLVFLCYPFLMFSPDSTFELSSRIMEEDMLWVLPDIVAAGIVR